MAAGPHRNSPQENKLFLAYSSAYCVSVLPKSSSAMLRCTEFRLKLQPRSSCSLSLLFPLCFFNWCLFRIGYWSLVEHTADFIARRRYGFQVNQFVFSSSVHLAACPIFFVFV
jgi:hypothetical protein